MSKSKPAKRLAGKLMKERFISRKTPAHRTQHGRMEMVNLTQCDLQRGVQLNPGTKLILLTHSMREQLRRKQQRTRKTISRPFGRTVTSTISVKDTGERKQLFGFTARHLIITMKAFLRRTRARL
jgi:hypothetical protein